MPEQSPTPKTQEQAPAPKVRPAAIIHASVLTGLAFGGAIRAADPTDGAFSSVAWSAAAALALLYAGDTLKTNGMITVGKFKPGINRLVVRVGTMVGSLMAVEHMVLNPDAPGVFGMAAAATIAGAAVLATTFPAPEQAKARKPGP